VIRDLAGQGAAEPLSADVGVIGGGIAGLILADELARAGHRVVVLESGARRQDGETHPLNAVEHAGSLTYTGAEAGRARCLGGTSTRWGGALIPFAAADCTLIKRGWDADWLGIHPELMARLERAEALFALPHTPYEEEALPPPAIEGRTAFVPRLAKWPSFGRRNVAALLAGRIDAPRGPEVILNATVDRFGFAPDGRLESVGARAPDGSTVTLRAPHFVLAAGAIESTRLLLLADRAADDRIFAPHDVLGRYFHDHVSVIVGTFESARRRALNKHIGFRFEGAGMRNLRFEAAEALRRAHDLPAAYAVVAFDPNAPGGFLALRQMLRRIQRRELPTAGDAALLLRSSGWLAQAVWWRLAHRRLLYPDGAPITLNMIIEQEPRRDNRITLSETLDTYGLPRARIDWSLGEADRQAMADASRLFLAAWAESGYGKLAELTLHDIEAVDAVFACAGGTSHPGGTTRIGASAASGVLDRELRAFGIPNLTVTATSAFPTGGAANPTMTLILATLRAADRLKDALRR
jgi:choline dehydrogenase-like flavoprotein